jgi:hypothetical protein
MTPSKATSHNPTQVKRPTQPPTSAVRGGASLDIGRTTIDLALEMKTTSVPDILEMLRNSHEEVEALTDKERDALLDAFRLAAVACSAWNYNNGFQDYALDAMQQAESL